MQEGPLFIASLVRDIAELRQKFGIDVVLVTSGAIASARLRLQRTWKTLPEKQALSALGQPMIMTTYNTALNSHGLIGAQVLLTYNDFKQPSNRTNFKNTIRQLRKWGAVPILNENDAVATDEIQFGDNDLLSALVAKELRAKKLILMTDVEGVFDRHPSEKEAKLIQQLRGVSKQMLTVAKTAKKSKLGRGGILSKLTAAKKASEAGVVSYVVRGSRAHVLQEIASGRCPGTEILASKKSG